MVRGYIYSYYSDRIHTLLGMYQILRVKLFLYLLKSFSWLCIEDKFGFVMKCDVYYNRWITLVYKFDLNRYLQVLHSKGNMFKWWRVVQCCIVIYNNMVMVGMYILSCINWLLVHENIFCNKICKSYWLSWLFSIYFIKGLGGYNKYYILWVYAIFCFLLWLENLVRCFVIDRSVDIRLCGISWLFERCSVVGVNIILVCVYMCNIYKYITNGMQIWIRVGGNLEKGARKQLVGLLKYYFLKMKWFE